MAYSFTPQDLDPPPVGSCPGVRRYLWKSVPYNRHDNEGSLLSPLLRGRSSSSPTNIGALFGTRAGKRSGPCRGLLW